ncbi:MAG: DUF3618 domain-containing protein, partial [Actinomycetota bacterium]|nr:DUF3618 domain-containing protein [Actinomycetota bacterium]
MSAENQADDQHAAEQAKTTEELEESRKQEAPSPEEIQADIQETREELGETVEALAHKADVKA